MPHTWVKDYVKYDGHNFQPIHIFLSCSGGTGKSHLVKVIYNAISKTLLYHYKDPEKTSVLLLGPTGISAGNIRGTTIYSGLETKLGIRLLSLNDKSKAALKNSLSEVKFLIIDKLSMVPIALRTNIDSKLWQIFMMISRKKYLVFQVWQ